MTVAEFGAQVLDEVEDGTVLGRGGSKLRKRTVKEYRRIWDRDLAPFFGPIRLRDVGRPDIEAFVRKRRSEGAAPATISDALVPLSLVLRQALARGLILHFPMDRMGVGRKAVHPSVAYPIEEINRRLDVLDGRDLAIGMLLADTGVRISEALGLRWGDIDFERSVVTVMHEWCPVEQKLIDPKTEAGKRSIFMTHRLADELLAYFGECDRPDSEQFLFPSPVIDGHPLTEQRVRNRLRDRWSAAGMSYINPHALRHSLATDLAAHSVYPTVLANILGHSDPAFTLKRYVHPSKQAMDEAIGTLGR